MKVRDIMTSPVLTCTPETSLAVVARRMRDEDYGTLAVVDAHGRLAGIITDRDICLMLAGSKRSAMNITVHEAMTHKVTAIGPDEDVHAALAAMKQARVRRLPVRDPAGALQGMLSIEDLVVRGIEAGGIDTHELVAALRAMYTRVPAPVTTAMPDNGLTPG
jgi:CBS domain-containing protein